MTIFEVFVKIQQMQEITWKGSKKYLCLKEAIFIGLFPGFLDHRHFPLALSWRVILAENGVIDFQVKVIN